jgi:hypothetical protein
MNTALRCALHSEALKNKNKINIEFWIQGTEVNWGAAQTLP